VGKIGTRIPSQRMKHITLGFIGSGRMAGAMVRGILSKQLLSAEQILCSGGKGNSARLLSEQTGITLATDIQQLVQQCTHLVIACKPAQLAQLDVQWSEWSHEKSFLSVLAGIPLRSLRKRFTQATSIVRSMPNTPAQVGAGITAFTPEPGISTQDQSIWQQLLGALGGVVEVQESELDLVTALSGSGPAYFFEITNQLTQAAVALGMSAETARLLARQTFIGAAKLLNKSGREAEDLRIEVTSPGGTTEAGLKVLSEHHLGELLQKTLQAASKRSQELSKAYE
jgi:pyrroline-5-carboxylate reductase